MGEDAGRTDGAAKKKRRAGRLIVLAVVFVLVGGGAAGGFLYWRGQAAAPDGAGHGAPQDGGHAAAAGEQGAAGGHGAGGGVLVFEPFVVNLGDTDASRFLRVNLRLVVADAERVAEIQHDEVPMLRVRSAVLELLSVQVSTTLVTPDGKAALKQSIAAAATPILGVEVTDVLFSEFVVQF